MGQPMRAPWFPHVGYRALSQSFTVSRCFFGLATRLRLPPQIILLGAERTQRARELRDLNWSIYGLGIFG